MTIKIQAFQRKGIKTKELVENWEFCCWEKLYLWLKKWDEHGLNKCPACKNPDRPKLSRKDMAKVINLLTDKIEKASPQELQDALDYMNSIG